MIDQAEIERIANLMAQPDFDLTHAGIDQFDPTRLYPPIVYEWQPRPLAVAA